MDQSNDLIDKFNLKLAKSIQLNKSIDLLAFEHALRIYVNKPQVVNKWVYVSLAKFSIRLSLYVC
jgi:hypothetical protein